MKHVFLRLSKTVTVNFSDRSSKLIQSLKFAIEKQINKNKKYKIDLRKFLEEKIYIYIYQEILYSLVQYLIGID